MATKTQTKKSVKAQAAPVKKSVYDLVTDRVITSLEKAIADKKAGLPGLPVWRQSWANSGNMPRSLSSGKEYRGINVLLLSLGGFSSVWFGTYDEIKRQAVTAYLKKLEVEKPGITEEIAKAIGADKDKLFYNKTWWEAVKYLTDNGFNVPSLGVRAGEKSLMVVFWSQIEVENKTPKKGEAETKFIPYLKYFSVFNATQADGLDVKEPEAKVNVFTPIEAAENIIKGYKNAPKVVTDKELIKSAHYTPSTDTVTMPEGELFIKNNFFYATYFHELLHSTGHATRLNRKGVTSGAKFGSEIYAKEELTAELGAAFLCALTGIENEALIENTVAYLENWLTVLKNDSKLIVTAAGEAQKAVDYMIGANTETVDE